MGSFSYLVLLAIVTSNWRYASAKSAVGSQVTHKYFELNITWEKHAPDGFERYVALINGQLPGPTLEINQGDEVEVLVHNNMPYNTTVHYHGIEMLGTPWSDGMPGLTQRKIQPGKSFLYKWKATQYGSYWYHAHERAQIDDGLYGPIIIHPSAEEPRPFSYISNDTATIKAMMLAEAKVRPLMLSDFRHVISEDGWNIEVAAGIETPCYDAILFNGKGSALCWSKEKRDLLMSAAQSASLALVNETSMTAKNCLPAKYVAEVLGAGFPSNISSLPPTIFDICANTTGATEVIEVAAPKCRGDNWVALDLIGAFGLVTGSFSIDNHPMYIYAVDGSYIKPLLVDALTISNGNRYSILINANKPGNYTIRMSSTTLIQMMTGHATLAVNGASVDSPGAAVQYIDDVGVNTTAQVTFFDQTAMKSFPPETISETADQTFVMGLRVSGEAYNWALNNTVYPMKLDNEEPLLFDPQPVRHNNVTITTYYGNWVDIIFKALTYPMPPHPIHKHGNKMWMIGQGSGEFNYSSVSEAIQYIPEAFNLIDPPKRDTISTPAAITGPAWMAIRYHVTNPGAWFLHCHIESHLIGGMGAAIQDGVDKWPEVPKEYLGYY